VLLNGFVALGRRTQPSGPSLEAEIRQLTSERDEARAERDMLQEENKRLSSQPGDEELKQRCGQLSVGLFRFLEYRDTEDPQKRPGWTPGNPFSKDPESRKRAQALTRHKNETRTEYSQRYAGEVGALLEALERRRWLEAKERRRLEEEVQNPLFDPSGRIRRIAERLSAIGKRL
jgi:hypothetical protein